MPSLPLVTIGSAVLRKASHMYSVPEMSLRATQRFIRNLKDTVKEHNGLGIAAPQVGVNKQVFIAKLPAERDTSEVKAPTGADGNVYEAFFNPRMLYQSDKQIKVLEGCLSIPNVRGLVPRSQHVRVGFYDRHGEQRVIEASGYIAAILQHEYDHVCGRIFTDRIFSKDDIWIGDLDEMMASGYFEGRDESRGFLGKFRLLPYDLPDVRTNYEKHMLEEALDDQEDTEEAEAGQ